MVEEDKSLKSLFIWEALIRRHIASWLRTENARCNESLGRFSRISPAYRVMLEVFRLWHGLSKLKA